MRKLNKDHQDGIKKGRDNQELTSKVRRLEEQLQDYEALEAEVAQYKIQYQKAHLDYLAAVKEKIDAEVARNIARDEVFELNKQNTDLILEANR